MSKLLIMFLGAMTSSLLFSTEPGIDRLMQGNKRFVTGDIKHPNRSESRRAAIVSSQNPFGIIVGCSDSRVPPEIIFDQGLGDLFIVRVAGNVIGPLELDSIEYAALYLHSSVILVLGHANCGAVNAVIQGITKDIESVAELIAPAIEEARKSSTPHLLEAAIKANALRMKEYLQGTPVIKKLIAEKKIEVQAGYYNLETGEVELLSKQP